MKTLTTLLITAALTALGATTPAKPILNSRQDPSTWTNCDDCSGSAMNCLNPGTGFNCWQWPESSQSYVECGAYCDYEVCTACPVSLVLALVPLQMLSRCRRTA